MEILCPECSTRFRLPPDKLGERGRRLRCSKCGHTWHQLPREVASSQGLRPAPSPLPERRPEPALAEGGGAEPVRHEAEGRLRPSAKAGPTEKRAPAESTAEARPLTAERPPSSAGEAARAGSAAAAAKAPSLKVGTGARAVPASDLPGDEDRQLRRRMDDLRRKRRRGMGRILLAGWLLFLLVVILLGGAGWLARDWVVARWPAATRLYEAVGLSVAHPGWGLALEGIEERYRPAKGTSEGKGQILELAGRVVNASNAPRQVPAIRVAILDAGGQVLVSEEVEPQERELAAGASTSFEVRLKMPAAGTDYRVSFADKP